MPELTVVKSWPLPQFDPTPDEARTLAEIRTRESNGDYAARNPKPGSTASGAYQFTSSTVSPTWQLATKATGAPVYSSAAEAPQAIQDANALHMLRQYGPNATITWAASGPYKQPRNQGGTVTAAQTPAGQPASDDVLSRIATGDVSPDELAQYLRPQQPAAAAETPKAAPAAPLTVVKSWPLPPPPPQDKQPGVVERFKNRYTQQTGINDLLDIIRASNRYGTPQEVAARGEKAQTALGHLVTGLRDEPARVWGEISGIGQSMLDPKQNTADMSMHMLGAVPMFGPGLQGFVHDVWAKKYPEAAADLAALGTLKYGPKALEAAEALPEAAQTARAAVSGAVKGGWEGGTGPTVLPIKIKGVQVAEIPGVPASIAGAVTGGGAGTLFGGPKLGIAGAVGGAAIPIVRGAVKGARSALADLEAARAAGATEAFPVPAEPAPGPITGPTDEALVHLYSVETDPLKRSALQAQLVDRGLIKAETATTPLEANPYRDYSQNALQRVYALEQDAAKRSLIEQAARDRNLTLLSREGRRATAAVPETGEVEARGPSLTQDDALMLRYLGETDPLAADAETIGIARKLAVDSPDLLRRLRAGETEPIVAPPTPAEAAAPTTQAVSAPLPVPLQRMVDAAQQAGDLTPQEQALADHILQNVEPTKPPATPPAAPQAAPPAPEPPAAAQAPSTAPVVPEAPQTLQPAAAVQKLTDYVLSKKIAPHMVDRLPAEYWQMIADDAGTAVPTADEIAQIKANVAAKAVETPPQGEQVFETQKARIEEGMTPPKKTPPSPAGGGKPPMPEGIPSHYQWIYDLEGETATTRAFLKDQRVADYLLSKKPPITPEEFAAKTLEEQNKLILEAPTKSGKGSHRAYKPKPEGEAVRSEGRWAHEGINDLVNTMRWRQAQTRQARPPITDFNRP